MRSCGDRRSGMLAIAALVAASCGCATGAGGEEPKGGESRAATLGSAQKAQVIRYLALGDSYTIGEKVAPEERWPMQLAARLRKDGPAVAEPEIVARTGWTTDELMTGIEGAAPSGRFDLVSLLIGVNNQYRGRDLEEYRAQFRALLDRAVSFAAGEAGRVIVVSIPDWGVTPFAEDRDRARIAAEIDRFNAVNREETEKARARYVDVTGVSRRAGTPGSGSLVASDGLHPSGEMYAEWARLILPQARAALGAVAPIDLAAPLSSLVEAERSFARASESDGTRAAFLAFLAEDSIVFEPGPVGGLKTWRQRPESPGLLTWYPVYADVSLLGDLGYTTGPWEYRGQRSDQQAAAHGQFLSIWKKQPNGAWKVVLDIGTTNPAPATRDTAVSHPPAGAPARHEAPGEANPDALRSEMLALERSFSEATRSSGAGEAHRRFTDPSIRLLQEGAFPIVGRNEVTGAVKANPGVFSWTVARAEVATSGDLAYAFGAYRVEPPNSAGQTIEAGSFVRVWKADRKGRFRVVAEVLHPDPPRPPAS